MSDVLARGPDAAVALMRAMPFAALVGIELTSVSPEEVRGRLAWRPELCTAEGVLHGAALMALGDSVGAVCAFLNLPEEAVTSTIESKTNFFRAVRGGIVESISQPLHVGRTTIVVQTNIFDSEHRRLAQVTQTQAVLAGRPASTIARKSPR